MQRRDFLKTATLSAACLATDGALTREGTAATEKTGKCWYQPLTDPHEAELGLRFTLSQPVTAAIPPGEESLFRLALDTAMNFKPITPDIERELRTLAATLNPVFTAA